VQALGARDRLVNNASILEYDNIASATRKQLGSVHYDSNLRAPFVLTQQLAQQVPIPQIDAQASQCAGLDRQHPGSSGAETNTGICTYYPCQDGTLALTVTAAQGPCPRVRVNGMVQGPTLQGARNQEGISKANAAATEC